jgi:hypothetical protein
MNVSLGDRVNTTSSPRCTELTHKAQNSIQLEAASLLDIGDSYVKFGKEKQTPQAQAVQLVLAGKIGEALAVMRQAAEDGDETARQLLAELEEKNRKRH